MNKISTDRQKLMNDIGEMWIDTIKWTLPRDTDTSPECSLSIGTINKDAKANIISTIQAMEYMDMLEPKLKIFGERLFKFMVKPILDDPNILVSNPQGEAAQLLVKAKKKGAKDKTLKLTDTFSKVISVFDFLNKHLFSIKVEKVQSSPSKSKKSKDKVSLMQCLGKLIGEEFTECVISTCLAKAIPTNKKELDEYHKVFIHPFILNPASVVEAKESVLSFCPSVSVLMAELSYKLAQNLAWVCNWIISQRSLMFKARCPAARLGPIVPHSALKPMASIHPYLFEILALSQY